MRALGWLGWTLSAAGLFCGCGSAEEPTGAGGAVAASTVSGSGGAGGASGGSGGAGGGIGAPSTVYPAPHEGPPVVTEVSGGSVAAAPRVHPVFFAGDDPAMVASLVGFYAKLGASGYWASAVGEYGVGPVTAAPTIQLSEAAPSSISFTEIDAWLAGKLDADDPAFAGWDGSSVFAIHFPAGVQVDIGGAKSCSAFGGYHENVLLDGAHGAKGVPYLVIPRCQSGGNSALDTTTAAATHELVEAATDPLPLLTPAYDALDDAHAFWAEPMGGAEIGDMCGVTASSYFHDPALGAFVPRVWSNVAAAAGHDPCVPAAASAAYFNSVPVLDETVAYHPSTGGTISAKGVHIPMGTTKIVEVDLFSEAAIGPWSVKALDVRTLDGLPAKLSFSLDATSGQNGQKLHLSITNQGVSSSDDDTFLLLSERAGEQHVWVGLVGG